MATGLAGGEPLMQVSADPGLAVLVVCTANRCRSVMTEALLSHRLAVMGVPGRVCSAGLSGAGQPPPQEVVSVMSGCGVDVAGHRSRLLRKADLASADLILAMAREHLRHAVAVQPSAWPRVFTLKELVRRGDQAGPRIPGESFPNWLARVHDGREHTALLGDSLQDDVTDPIGGPVGAYARTATLLDQLVDEATELCWGLPAGRLPG